MITILSLGVGTMLGEAIFHIIPEVVLEVTDKRASLCIVVILVFGFFFFFLLETIIPHTHDAHHSDLQINDEDDLCSSSPMCPQIIRWSSVLPVLITDILHNFVDGLALGTASRSWQEGLALFLAIVFHEIGHELANFMLLKKIGGLGNRLALMFNICAAAFSLVGSIVGRLIGEHALGADKYILSFTAGGFLYISCVQVLPHLLHENAHSLCLKILRIIPMIFGFVLLFVIAYYEEELEHWFC